MTITADQARELRKRIRRLAKAEVEHSWKGTDMAEAHASYDEELRLAKESLKLFIDQITERKG